MSAPLDKKDAKALVRYQVISAYIAMEPGRGQRRKLLEQLAGRTWTGPDGEPFQVAAETIRSWVRRYRREGLPGLADKERPRRGCKALTPEQVELACKLKREVPERSLDRILRIMEEMQFVEPGTVTRSSLHRTLKALGLSARRCRVPDSEDLDRFEAAFSNDLWQSDMLEGPWLPDPDHPGKVRRAHLYAFIDDHSRLLLHGRFSFKGDLPALELVLRRCFQKYGLCRRFYYDNGKVYRAIHMKHIAASVGVHPIEVVFTKVKRPMGHGKIEAFNRLVRNAFLAELKASRVTTLDELNEAFVAWVDMEYNRKVHSETGERPIDRWRAGIKHVRHVDERKLRQAFLWRENRTTDKAGVFSLFGIKYQLSPGLVQGRRRIDVRYDPEALELVEVWREGKFLERVRPFSVHPNRRPRGKEGGQPTEAQAPAAPTADWIGHLVTERRKQFLAPAATAASDVPASPAAPTPEMVAADQAVFDLLAHSVDPAVFDAATVTDYLRRFGPFNPEHARCVLEQLIADTGRADHHVTFYLDAIRNDAQQRTGDKL